MKQNIFLLCLVCVIIVIFTGCSQKRGTLFKTKYTTPAWHKATMKPYNVMGKRYYPRDVSIGEVQYGLSSWYGPDFHGKQTSNGEVYNMHARTAAHKTWPMDTMVKVTNMQNGKSTVVRINDRGPFVRGRIIDCSYAAGKQIGLDKMGIAKVRLKVLGFAGKTKRLKKKKRDKNLPNSPLVKQAEYALQLGAFSNEKRAKKQQLYYARRYTGYKPVIKRIYHKNGMILSKVLLMGFFSEQEARNFKENNQLYHATVVRNT